MSQFPVNKNQYEPVIGQEPISVVFRAPGGLTGAVADVKTFDIELKKKPGRIIYPNINASGGMYVRHTMVLYAAILVGGGTFDIEVSHVKGADLDDDTGFTKIVSGASAGYKNSPSGDYWLIPAQSILRVVGGTGQVSAELILKRAKSDVST